MRNDDAQRDNVQGNDEALRDQVRQRYGAAARAVREGQAADRALSQRGCCGDTGTCGAGSEADSDFGSGVYGNTDLSTLPADAVAASLGCGNPTAIADLRLGERVLDLGSGGGIDVLLSARRVGEHGVAYGVDMVDEHRSERATSGRRVGSAVPIIALFAIIAV